MRFFIQLASANILFLLLFQTAQAQTTQIPNADFENWVSYSGYSDPQYWDTPNQELLLIPIFGQAVVSKSSSHSSGSYSARLETKTINIPGAPVDVPGVVTLGKMTIDILAQTYEITGGVPIHDQPTHLKGFFKYAPVGGDSCGIGILLFKTTAGIKDTVAIGFFSSKINVPDWTPFSAWINYLITADPDTMNILAMSTAQYELNNGTVLYVDDLSLDYTLGINDNSRTDDISVYQDKETRRLLVFTSPLEAGQASLMLFDLTGQNVSMINESESSRGKTVISYDKLKQGIYILEVLQGHRKYCQKFFLNQ